MTPTKNYTPGGNPGKLENPPFSKVGSTDSGGSQSLQQQQQEQQPTSPTRPTIGSLENLAAGVSQQGSSPLKRSSAIDFYKAWQSEKKARSLLEKIVECLQEKIEKLEKISNEKETVVYCTDEEELERDTDWVLKTKKKRPSKKRRVEESPEFVARNEETAVSKKVTTTRTGNFAFVAKNVDKNDDKHKEPKPPPIMISGVGTFDAVKKLTSNIDQKKCNYTSYSNNIWKINVDNSESYRSVTSELNEQEVQWHTYEDKASRPIKVMARGLHSTCDEKEIITDLQQEGFLILDAKNILQNERIEKENGDIIIKKRALPLFMLSFDNKESIEKIYALKKIMNIIVKIEPLRKNSSMILQCKRCQAFGHTKGYCNKDPACVKCAGRHFTKNCTIGKDVKAKCVNCREAHPASYRGCQIAKMHQQRKNKQLLTQRKQRNMSEVDTKSVKTAQNQRTDNTKTFASIVRNSRQEEEASVKEMLATILKRLDSQDKIIKKLVDEMEEPNPISHNRIRKKCMN